VFYLCNAANLRHTSDAEVPIRSQEAHLLSIRIDTSQPHVFSQNRYKVEWHTVLARRWCMTLNRYVTGRNV